MSPATLDDLAERIRVAGVVNLDHIRADLRGDAGRVLDDLHIVLALDLLSPRVDHRDEGHAPFLTRHGHLAEVPQHLAFISGPQVHVDRDRVSPVLDGALNAADQNLVIRVRGQRRARRQVQDEADVTSVPSVTEQRKSHVPQHRVRPALRSLVHRRRHVYQARDRSHRHPMIHRHDHGASILTITDSLETNGFPKH